MSSVVSKGSLSALPTRRLHRLDNGEMPCPIAECHTCEVKMKINFGSSLSDCANRSAIQKIDLSPLG